MRTVESASLGIDEIDYALHMRHALQLAENVMTTAPNPRVGCVVVAASGDNDVVGEGWHQRPGGEHAEIFALSMAGERARGSTVFISLEPCAHHGKTPPCTDALIQAAVGRVIIAALDPFPQVAGLGVERLEQAGIEVILLADFEERARAINAGYLKRLTRGLPFVRCKMAMSLDGRTAAANGESKWISGAHSRADVQRLRAASCAIITGVGTVLQDDPALTVRPAELNLSPRQRERDAFALSRQPMRVILDSHLRTPDNARILQQPGQTRLFTLAGCNASHLDPAKVITVDPARESSDRVDPRAVLELLATKFTVNDVLLEAGPTLSGAFVQAGLVDELILYVAAKLLGSQGRPLVELPSLLTMSDGIGLTLKRVDRLGDDCRIVAAFD